MGGIGAEGELVLVRIHARQPARAARFYQRLFGWEVHETAGGGVSFRTREGLAGAFRAGEPSTAGPELFVRVDRLEPAVARAVALGGTTLVRPGVAEGGRMAQVLDPEGNRIGLYEAAGEPSGETPVEGESGFSALSPRK